ncbi:Regulator_of chromosome condensation 1/beta-lactamase-inhibitor protein II [Hexamita inflata]|uniref:Regulator of chromosome condensation 1/beta-lactamase-inhibitor protein II n=1 Tax=Hexamita inflata TaxID=28002 RepID=A0AA86NQC3_9EUKA|nr:Regulator of chromosome condensation 1/beta-lactamase-inhibitor protein II [Hexamita inflata]
MFIAISLQTVQTYSYVLNTGFVGGVVSNESVTDVLMCGSATYQILQNNSIMGKGSKAGILNNSGAFAFVYIGVDNAKQMYCFNNLLYYLTTSNIMMRENMIVLGKMTYIADQGAPKNIRQVAMRRSLLAVLSENGLYVKGLCSSKICIHADGTYPYYVRINITPLAVQDVSYLQFDYNASFMYVYMNNGDVYAAGSNILGYFPEAPYPDLDSFRLIGRNITNVTTGWNASRTEYSSYYLKDGDMFVYNVNATPPQRLFAEKVQQFNTTTSVITYLQNGVLNAFVEQFQLLGGLLYYCNFVPTDPLCTKYLSGTYVFSTDCLSAGALITNLEFCKISNCLTTGTCGISYCHDETNITCKAIICSSAVGRFTPYCSANYKSKTDNIQLDSPDYKMSNSYLIPFTKSSEPVVQSMKSGAAVGISVACCVVILGLVGTFLIVKLLKTAKGNKKVIADISALQSTDNPKILVSAQNL